MKNYESIIRLNQVDRDQQGKEKYYQSIKKISKELGTIKDPDLIGCFVFLFDYHTGMRKGNKLLEMQHQLDLVVDLIEHKKEIEDADLDFLKLVKLALIHDLYEDYNEKDEIWNKKLIRLEKLAPITIELLHEKIKDQDLIDKSLALSKVKEDFTVKKSKHYYRELKSDLYLVVIKLLDRKNSLSTMKDAFTKEKQENYIDQYRKQIMPLAESFSHDKEVVLLNKIKESIDHMLLKNEHNHEPIKAQMKKGILK